MGDPEFTDTARAALLWVLWHHQGGSSKVGQPLRFALGMGAHDRLSDSQVEEARRWGELHATDPTALNPTDFRGAALWLARLVQQHPDFEDGGLFYERAQAVIDAAEIVLLTDAEIEEAALAVLVRYDDGIRKAATYDKGPYEITHLRPWVLDVIRAAIATQAAPAKDSKDLGDAMTGPGSTSLRSSDPYRDLPTSER